MENASKALIIAGSILVSIVIITLGVMIVSNVTSTIQNNSNLTEQEVLTYNQKFLSYEGTKSGTQARALCDLVRQHNNMQDDKTRQIVVQTADATGVTQASEEGFEPSAVDTIKKGLYQGKTYTITFGYDSNSGLIVAIGITAKGSKT